MSHLTVLLIYIVMMSFFNPNACASASQQKAQNADHVTLCKSTCFADVVAGSSEILNVHKTVSGLWKIMPFAQGEIKLAFDVSLFFYPQFLLNQLSASFISKMVHSWWPNTSSM